MLWFFEGIPNDQPGVDSENEDEEQDRKPDKRIGSEFFKCQLNFFVGL